MAENQFSVAVPNIYQALMAGEQGYKDVQGYRKEQDQSDARKQAEQAIAAGGDPKTALARLIGVGDYAGAAVLSTMQKQQLGQDASNNFTSTLSTVLGQPGGPTVNVPLASSGPTSVQPGPVAPATALPRAEVKPSQKVWGDKEAEAAGLYDTPKAPLDRAMTPVAAAAPVAAPTAPSAAPAAPQATPARPQAMLGGAPLQKIIPALIAAAGNPNLPAEQRTMATELLKSALDEAKLPPDQKDYALYQTQGGTDTYTDWMRKNKQAGATAITNDMRGENAESQAIGKGAGERATATVAAAGAAPKKLQNLARMDSMLSQVAQGKIEPARMNISAWAKSFGLDDAAAERLGLDPKGVGTAQAVAALSNELTLGHIGSGGMPANNFSNTDREFITSIVPQLGNDPRGNKLMIEAARRMSHLDIDKGKEWLNFRRDPANKGRSFDDFEIQWADRIAKKDIFGDLRREADQLIGAPQQQTNAQGGRTPVKVTTPDEARKLPKGTQIILPDGSLGVVP